MRGERWRNRHPQQLRGARPEIGDPVHPRQHIRDVRPLGLGVGLRREPREGGLEVDDQMAKERKREVISGRPVEPYGGSPGEPAPIHPAVRPPSGADHHLRRCPPRKVQGHLALRPYAYGTGGPVLPKADGDRLAQPEVLGAERGWKALEPRAEQAARKVFPSQVYVGLDLQKVSVAHSPALVVTTMPSDSHTRGSLTPQRGGPYRLLVRY
jgi:hypothetical protein